METSQRFQVASKPPSIRHLWREPWENRRTYEKRFSMDFGFLLFSSSFQISRETLYTPEVKKKKKGIESERDSLAARASEKGRSGIERGKEIREEIREEEEEARLSILRTVVKVRHGARLISAFLAPKIFAPLSAPA